MQIESELEELISKERELVNSDERRSVEVRLIIQISAGKDQEHKATRGIIEIPRTLGQTANLFRCFLAKGYQRIREMDRTGLYVRNKFNVWSNWFINNNCFVSVVCDDYEKLKI